MSAEIPKGNQGRLPGFLRRLFKPSVAPVESQQILPSTLVQPQTPKIVQPPPGLEDFAAMIHQGKNGYFAELRQQDLDRHNEAVSYLAARTAEKAIAAQRQQAIEDQEKARVVEAMEIIDSFHIPERLRYIRDSRWEGKGELRMIGSLFGRHITYCDPYSGYPHSYRDVYIDRLGGVELAYEYPSFVQETQSTGWDTQRWMFKPTTNRTSLSVFVENIRVNSGKPQKVLKLSSEAFHEGTPFRREILEATIPVHNKDVETLLTAARAQEQVEQNGSMKSSPKRIHNKEIDLLAAELNTRLAKYPLPQLFMLETVPIDPIDSEALLLSALAQETANREIGECLPKQLEQKAKEATEREKQGPHWLRWTTERVYCSD